MRKPPYRTLGGLLGIGAMMLGALWMCRGQPQAEALLPSVISGLGMLGGFLAAKSAVEHATNKETPK